MSPCCVYGCMASTGITEVKGSHLVRPSCVWVAWLGTIETTDSLPPITTPSLFHVVAAVARSRNAPLMAFCDFTIRPRSAVSCKAL